MDILDHFVEKRLLVDEYLKEHVKPLQLICVTFVASVVLVKIWSILFNGKKEETSNYPKDSIFKRAEDSTVKDSKHQERTESSAAELNLSMFPLKDGQQYRTKLPEKGIPTDDILEILQKEYKNLETIDWENGRCFGAVYSGGNGAERFLSQVFGMFVGANLLQPDVFPGPRKMEAEIVAMVTNMFRGGKDACGVVTSGGSESIMLACKSYRDLAYKRGITEPEILMPESAHAAFVKAAEYFRMKVVKVPLDEKTFKVDFDKMKSMVSNNTAMLVGSAPSFPHGTCDPIEDIGRLGKQHNIPLHVDQCMGGFVTPFAGKEFNIPPCDFSVDGVTSISADTHKYGMAPKGSSTLTYSHYKYREGQYFVRTDWSGGIYASPTMAGTRSGAIVATCWASIMKNGFEGYRATAEKVLKCRQDLENGLRAIEGINVFGEPEVSIISFGSDVFDIYRLGDQLTAKGWHMFLLQNPPGLNLVVTPLIVDGSNRGDFLRDVTEETAKLMKDPSGKSEVGMAAIYGVATKMSEERVASEFATDYLNAYYNTKSMK